MISLAVVALVGYLVGSVSTSILVARLIRGIDIREHGSGNAGAANVVRVLGWGPGFLVLLADFAKGVVGAALVPALGFGPVHADAEVARVVGGVSAVAGHVWPALAGFRGGKGVATAGGAILVLSPVAFVACALAFAATAVAFRIVSAASLVAAVTLPVALVLSRLAGDPSASGLLIGGGAVLAALVLWTHRGNLARLVRGTEGPLEPPGP